MKNVVSIFIIILFGHFIKAQSVIRLEGHFQGQNLYLQNATSGDSLCVDSIKVNRNKLPVNLSAATIEIKFKDLNLNLADEIIVQIYHKEDCKPKILNSNFMPKRPFTINTIEFDSDGNLIWEAICEDTLTFNIEQFRWNKWIKVGGVKAKGKGKSYRYKYKVSCHSGENKFRITHINKLGKPHYSKGVRFNPNVKENKMVCTLHKDDITFEIETTYEIYNDKGQKLLSGFGNVVDISTLTKGIYYINYDNKTDTFVKKK